MKSRKNLEVVIAGVGIAFLFAAGAAPYAIFHSLQYTGVVIKQTQIDQSIVPVPISFYLQSGATYYIYMVRQAQIGETFPVISQQRNVPTGSLVYINSTVKQFFVDPNSKPPIPVDPPQPYDHIVLGSLEQVSASLVSYDTYFTQDPLGGLLLGLSTGALALPLAFAAVVWIITKRIALWSFVIVAWFYAGLFFATDFLGSAYGLPPSILLGGAVVGLPVAAFVTSKVERLLRERLFVKSSQP